MSKAFYRGEEFRVNSQLDSPFVLNQFEEVRVFQTCAWLVLSRTCAPASRTHNHREAGRHLPQQFGGSRLDGDFAFRMEGYAAVLSRDGQGGALLREVAKLEKFKDDTTETLGRSCWDVQQLSAAVAADLTTCTR